MSDANIIYVFIGIIFLFIIIYNSRWDIRVINKQQVGVWFSTIYYTDTNGGKLLVAKKLDLQGKPDYIFRKIFTAQLIPLELKSGTLKEDYPHEGDLYQLITYFLIIEEVYNKRPPYGKLVYKNKTFIVKNTYGLRQCVLKQISLMRDMLNENIVQECYKDFVKCRHCICRETVCEMPKRAVAIEKRFS
ncbi:MAG: hypothetical protein BEN19_04880 [Epulopiscium sp. Nuni2H_MBin003]|nr:MAG: hypothetical protein BEN19_04880 [Epulopiscium sp. Nuni2H_MBin003]